MKKSVLVLICLLLFLITAGAGAAWLWLSPEGAMRSDLPEKVAESYLADKTPDFWREEYLRQISLPATEFENGAELLPRLYDAAVGDAALRFSPLTFESEGNSRCFLISLGEADLFRLVTRYQDSTWQVTELTALDNLAPVTHEISVLLPSDAALRVNGVPVGEGYVRRQSLDYPDMSALELSLGNHPTRTEYVISGLYEAPTVEAEREGGLVLLSAADGVWEYTVPDAAGYAFAVSAPRGAVVRLGDRELGSENIAATTVYNTQLDIPLELQSYLPEYVIYTAGGLYSLPEITAAMPDGTALSATEKDGVLTFSLPGTETLREAQHSRPEEFIRAMTAYGSGNGTMGYAASFVSKASQVQDYLSRAINSVYWTHYVTLSFQNVTADNFIPLGDDAFLCRTHAEFNTHTWFQDKDLSWDFEMIWRNENGEYMLWDLAFL